MRKPLDRPIGRIGLAIAAIGIVCGAASAYAQVEPMVQAQVGLVEFRIPKEFVSNWVRSRQHLGVHFSYPEIEPLGRFRFGDDNIREWTDHQQALVKRGGNILYVTLDPIHNPEPLPEKVEIERILNAICKRLGIEKFDSYSEYEIDFFGCRDGSIVVAHVGHQPETGLNFRWDIHTGEWRVSKRNLKERVYTAVHFRKEDLKNWKAINARAHAMLDSWKN